MPSHASRRLRSSGPSSRDAARSGAYLIEPLGLVELAPGEASPRPLRLRVAIGASLVTALAVLLVGASAFLPIGRPVVAMGSLGAFTLALVTTFALRRAQGGHELAERRLAEKNGALEAANHGLALATAEAEAALIVVEEALRARDRTLEALARSHRDLDQFAYVTSHDLKAPLRGIASLAAWIEEDLGDGASAETSEHLRLLRGRVIRMEGLIDGILEYARAGRIAGGPERVDTRELVLEIVALLAPPPGARVEVDDSLPVLVTHRGPLQQVLVHVLGNALHHADRHDLRVRVRAKDAGSSFELSIADDGRGIAPRFHERIFQIFQTLDARDQREGAGIGLAIVKKIVDTVGGDVRVESEEGRGATFFVRWPKGTIARTRV